MMCRNCEAEHEPDELTASGLCQNCIPLRGPAPPRPRPNQHTTTRNPPASNPAHPGPGRIAVRKALAGYRADKTKHEETQ